MRIVLERGGIEESDHEVDWALVDSSGALKAGGGRPDKTTFFRSAAKPFQTIPLVDDGAVSRWGITTRELALCCGSHDADEAHLEGVRSLLDRIGVAESALSCGAHPPMGARAARALAAEGRAPEPIHNNCSGKHAGMLALARHHGWGLVGYHQPDHPVQRRLHAEVARWAGLSEEEIGTGIDGCGVVSFAIPVREMALAFARLVRASHRGEPGAHAVVAAMARHPYEVAGTGRLCTALMDATKGRIIAKVGAEGVYCAADREHRLGLALKVRDGARRAAESALVEILLMSRLLDAEEVRMLGPWKDRVVPNTRGEPAARLGAERVERVRDGQQDTEREDLPAVLRALVRVSGALARRDGGSVERELLEARRVIRGPSGALAIEEAIVQGHLFVGFPAILNALAAWRRHTGQRDDDEARRGTDESIPESNDGLTRRGEELCRRVYGGQYDALRENIAWLHPDIDRWMIRDGYGKVLGRPGLSLIERELCIVAILAVLGAPVQLHSHLRGALSVGASARAVGAVLREVEDWVPLEDRVAVWDRWRRVRERAELDDRHEE